MGWAFLTNLVVILASRGNLQLTSHRKSLLQLLLCLQINYLVGSPRLNNPDSVLNLIVLLQVLIYQDFGALCLFFALAPHFSSLQKYDDRSQVFSYFAVYFLFYWIMAPLFRNFIYLCMAS
jgi:hypothetical protein